MGGGWGRGGEVKEVGSQEGGRKQGVNQEKWEKFAMLHFGIKKHLKRSEAGVKVTG